MYNSIRGAWLSYNTVPHINIENTLLYCNRLLKYILIDILIKCFKYLIFKYLEIFKYLKYLFKNKYIFIGI